MARYRTYKNGIYGHRHNGYYIVKGAKGEFSILNPEGELYKNNLLNYDDCEWEIDKITATESELSVIELLYAKEIYELSALFVELIEKKDREGLDEKSKELYKWVEKVRKRKASDLAF